MSRARATADQGRSVGTLMAFAAATAPAGWLSCDGSAVSRTTYANLFAVIGTTWGVGNGSTTFNLPDAREAALTGAGTRGSGVTEHDVFTVGEFKDDSVQGHNHVLRRRLTNIPNGTGASTSNVLVDLEDGSTANSSANTGAAILNMRDDGTNGSPRAGKTTRGKRLGALICIKY